MKHSEQLNELFAALSKAQGEMKPALLDCVNPHFRSKYASLTAIQEAYREPLAKHSLSLVQLVESSQDGYQIHTCLGHSSGQFISTTFQLLLGKSDMQALGSAITYARRYSLCALLGIVDMEDDDGNRATASVKSPVLPSKVVQGANELDRALNQEPEAFKRAREQREKAEKEAEALLSHNESNKYAPPSWHLDTPLPDDPAGPVKPGDYVIGFGKDQGKTIAQMGIKELNNRLDWISKQATKPLSHKLEEFVKYANEYLRGLNG